MKNSDIPCPPPENFKESEPLAVNKQPTPSSPAYWPFGTKGEHLKDGTDTFFESVWNVPDGRRK